jgi:DNA-binding SARP family transcriptional activator
VTNRIEFGLLGPLVVRREGTLIPVARGRQSALLAALLLDAGRLVTVGQLTEVLWGDGAPASARAALHNQVRRLRDGLGTAGRDRIRTGPGGYLIRVEPDELDVTRMQLLLASARAAAGGGAWEHACVMAADAVLLWRGQPLADVDSDVLARRIPDLTETYRQAAEMRLEAQLNLGHHAETVSELRRFTADQPFREHPYALLMTALYRCGRQGEAIAVYQQARRLLIDELGCEPGPELRRVHQQILNNDPALAAPQPTTAAAGQSSPVPVAPRELPAAIWHFTGRARELRALTKMLDRMGDPVMGAVVTCAVGGTAGVGKTALALHFAHRVAHRFTDGQLYVNLRGFAPSGVPVTPPEAVRGFLDALGVPPERIPARWEAQAGLYRSLLADRKMLIVLDNARDEQQVRPLLPASPASLVIVTSRNQLAGLAAADGARLLSLEVLPHSEAVQLLTARIGASRAAAEPEAAVEMAALCACLPLALAVAAARAAARPRLRLTELAAELRGAAERLDALDAGDPAVSVRAVFSCSYRQLSPAAARMFRLLGLHPGPDISVPAAASLAAVDEPEARRLLSELARDHLVTEHGPGRYAFHDLLRVYAASKARDCDSQPDRDAAIGRVLDHYLHTAARAAFLVQPGEQLALAAPRPGAAPWQPGDRQQALAWFVAEHQVLLAAVALAAETGTHSHAWQLPWAMTAYLNRRGYLQERVTVMGTALAAATRLDDPLGQAMSMRGLGSACTETGDHDQSRAHLEHCLPLYRRLGDRHGEAWAQYNLSVLAGVQGRYADALGHSEQALRLFRAIGDEAGQALLLNGAAMCHILLGDYQQARAFCEQSLALIGKLDDCHLEYYVRDTLGYTELHIGDVARAAEHFELALVLCRDSGDRYTEAEILSHLGDARHAAGEVPAARQAWQQALAVYDDFHHPDADKIRAKLASTEG